MPLPKQIQHDEHDDERPRAWPLAPFVGFVEWPLTGFAECRRMVGVAADFFMPKVAKSADSPADLPRVGEYFADYSDLTPEEIAALDSECSELFKRSKPVSR